MKIKKHNGKLQEFSKEKIEVAILKAAEDIEEEIPKKIIKKIVNEIEENIEKSDESRISSDEISKLVEWKLMKSNFKKTAKQYIEYRYRKKLVRESNTTDKAIKELLEGQNEYWNTENSNKNAKLVTTQRDYIAGITSTDIARRFLLPKEIVKAHDEGIIHFHDIDYFAEVARTNCELINLEDMLQNGTMINGVKIEKPHRFLTACTIATQIITAVSSSTYGGATISLAHLAPFVKESYKRYLKEYKRRGLDEEKAKEFAELDAEREIKDGVQTFNYQVNSMSSTNGQAPFISVSMYLGETTKYKKELAMIIEEFLKQRIQGLKNEKGIYVTQAFPKLLYFLEEDNIHEDSKYWYLTELAAKCSAKRLTPDYISVKMMKQLKINKFGNGDVYACMGCRSFLTPDRIKGNPANALNYKDDKGKYYGRFNQGVVTISLPDIALSSKGNKDKFWKIFDERMELCHKALQCRHERLKKISPDNAPILWKDGALARLSSKDSVEPLLKGGYSTLSLGYAGLYECVKYMTGESHTNDNNGKIFGLEVMQALNDKCAEWKKEEDIDYSVYGTPIESTTYKFAKELKRRFGDDVFIKMDGKDRNYITNSYHIPVFEEIDAFDKLTKEAKFQQLSPGGAISYVEVPNMQNNIPAVLVLMKHIYNTILYAELNTKSDYCQECGYEGEIEIKEDENKKLIWQCPNCGNTNQNKMNVARRTCGLTK